MTRLFGYEVSEFGDAYDLTSLATKIGGQFFDFSLKLIRNGKVERILYDECKYRDEKTGSTTNEFEGFLIAVYRALSSAAKDESSAAEFCFVTNIPPNTWRKYLRSKQPFLNALVREWDSQVDTEPELVTQACTK